MENQALSFENFLYDVSPQYQPFAQKIHDELIAQGYKLKLEMAKSGYLVSYSHPKTKRSILNFVFRKGGLVTRLYADNLAAYAELLRSMPKGLVAAVAKAPVCKRLIDPTACNSRCPMGYAFELHDENHKKCRYSCFFMPVNDENVPFLDAFVAAEIRARAAV